MDGVAGRNWDFLNWRLVDNRKIDVFDVLVEPNGPRHGVKGLEKESDGSELDDLVKRDHEDQFGIPKRRRAF